LLDSLLQEKDNPKGTLLKVNHGSRR